MSIEVKHITKTFGSFTALRDVSLRVNDGELVALLGPSGSGKTTLLRIIAGLEVPDIDPASEILFDESSVTGRPVGQRHVGFVFQHYALFRHMTVFENIAFGLRVRPRDQRPSKSEIRDRVNQLLKLVQLENFGNRYPTQLSGGQRQRVALARALAVEPKVLLLDEPFGALDAKVRQGLRDWLRKLHDEIHLTSVLVTHDQEEALEVADEIVIINEGRVEQVGSPDELYDQPRNEFVMRFVGPVTELGGRLVRPHDLELHREEVDGGVSAEVVDLVRVGFEVRVHFAVTGSDAAGTGQIVQVQLTRPEARAHGLEIGERFWLRHIPGAPSVAASSAEVAVDEPRSAELVDA